MKNGKRKIMGKGMRKGEEMKGERIKKGKWMRKGEGMKKMIKVK